MNGRIMAIQSPAECTEMITIRVKSVSLNCNHGLKFGLIEHMAILGKTVKQFKMATTKKH